MAALSLACSFISAVPTPLFIPFMVLVAAAGIAKTAITRTYGLLASRIPVWPIFWKIAGIGIVATLIGVSLSLLLVLIIGYIGGKNISLSMLYLSSLLVNLLSHLLAIPFYGRSILSLFARQDIQWMQKRDLQLIVRTIRALGRLGDSRAIELIEAVRERYGEADIESIAPTALAQIRKTAETR